MDWWALVTSAYLAQRTLWAHLPSNLLRVDGGKLSQSRKPSQSRLSQSRLRKPSQSRRAENLLRLDEENYSFLASRRLQPLLPPHTLWQSVTKISHSCHSCQGLNISDVEKEKYFCLASRRLLQPPTFGRCHLWQSVKRFEYFRCWRKLLFHCFFSSNFWPLLLDRERMFSSSAPTTSDPILASLMRW